jgi:hypothetical protein
MRNNMEALINIENKILIRDKYYNLSLVIIFSVKVSSEFFHSGINSFSISFIVGSTSEFIVKSVVFIPFVLN